MTTTSMTRRPLLLGALAGALVAPTRVLAQQGGVFAAGGLRGETFFVASADAQQGAFRELSALGGRAHQVVALGTRGDVIAVGRRADRWATIVNAHAPRGPSVVAPGDGHFFSGHVAVSPDGASAAFVEIRDSDGAGFLSIRETSGWRETRRASTGGIGPHMAL